MWFEVDNDDARRLGCVVYTYSNAQKSTDMSTQSEDTVGNKSLKIFKYPTGKHKKKTKTE